MLSTIGTYATIFGTLIAGITLYFFLTGNPLEKNKREISFIVRSTKELLDIPKLFRDQFRIMVGDEIVTDLDIISIDFKNTGDTAIIPAYYEDGITIRYRKNCRVISGYVSSDDENFSKHELHIGETSASVKPFLINKGDHFTINLFCVDSLSLKVDVLFKAIDTNLRQVKIFDEKNRLEFHLL